MAVGFIALPFVVCILLNAAAEIEEPSWVRPVLVVSAVTLVLILLLWIFLMQTKFRKELQEDRYYSEWLQRHEQTFVGFKPENTESKDSEKHTGDLEPKRIKKYQDNRGLFLIHSWRPSLAKGQVADIVIWLHQHGNGPLTQGVIEKVEYELGPKFFNGPILKTNREEQFRLEVSAYGPMLCLARIHFKDGSAPILLERYIEIDEAPNVYALRANNRYRR
jgi:hypothetical protein